VILSASFFRCATFRVGELFLGIDVRRVQELIRQQDMSPVPLAPQAIKGLINLRGQIVIALDPRRSLGLQPALGAEPRVNIVVKSGDAIISLLVDEICDVVDIPAMSCVEVPDNMPLEQRQLMQCVVRLEHELMLVLDSEKLFDTACN
jgi:purine-binding chemotaxis protein CheW